MSLTDVERITLHRYWLSFKKGLLVFVVGVLFILVGYRWQAWWQIPGLILLLAGGLFSAYGYIGILRFRLKSAFHLNAKQKRDKKL
ncbi:hypothetical protein [Planctobacterium marinum]|uniref:Transmembrane protein n=1 Tax=Planctobacterium marinum TaxID=1631968 RepID=A0AA48HCM5_9ALTE|nr:hypothetical protein MACH26_00890 [Planctobacterium marinum]